MNCSARHCSTTISESRAFCNYHWGLVPRVYRIQLCDAYGTEGWGLEVKKCVRQVFLIESKRGFRQSA